MINRSRIHMLTMLAASLPLDDKTIRDQLLRAIKDITDKRREGRRERDEIEAEDQRAARQRSLWTMVEQTRGIEKLKQGMLQRAYDLLWDGSALECDAIAEFLPWEDVKAMYDAWESDQEGKNPKSKFYK